MVPQRSCFVLSLLSRIAAGGLAVTVLLVSGAVAVRAADPAVPAPGPLEWVIYVRDTQKMKGPLLEPMTIDFEAVNLSGIAGEYAGAAEISWRTGADDVAVEVVSTSTQLDLRVVPVLAVGGQAGAGGNLPRHVGSGTMKMATVSTARVDGQVSQRTSRSELPFTLEIVGPRVVLVVQYPKGTVTFHGHVIGEGRGARQAKARPVRRPAKPAREEAPPKLAPLKPIPAEPAPELAPLQPIPAEPAPGEPELAPLAPIKG